MTRKDYILIADHIKHGINYVEGDKEDFIAGMMVCIGCIGKAFTEDNPRFDMERWIDYVTSDL